MKKWQVAIIVLVSVVVVHLLAVSASMPSVIDVPHSVAAIQEVYWSNSTGQIIVTVQHCGYEPVTLSEVYVNGTLDSSAEFTRRELSAGAFSEITLSETYENKPTETTIRVACVENSFAEIYFNSKSDTHVSRP